VTDGKKMEGSCSTDQSPHWAVVPVEEEEDTCPKNKQFFCTIKYKELKGIS
jgi:hypothetical protein